MSKLRWTVAFIIAAAISHAAYAQVLYGSLTGNVFDPSSATIPNAKVEALNTNTGAVRNATTDAAGIYVFANLQPGTYKVTVTTNGFETAAEENVGVSANETKRVDFHVQLTQATQTVEVAANATQLKTDRADVSTRIDPSQIASLPFTSSAGRNVQALYKLIPGFSLVLKAIARTAEIPSAP